MFTNRCLFLPIETQVRELDSKLLIGVVAANKGLDVYIGWKEHLRSQPIFTNQCYILEKSASPGTLNIFERLKKRNFSTGVLDEEGLLYLSKSSYLERRIDRHSIKLIDNFFTWGIESKNILRNPFNNKLKKIIVTGNPRIDLLRPQFYNLYDENRRNIRANFGKYILINTNFGICNWKSEKCDVREYVENMKLLGKVYTKRHENELKRYFEYKLKNMYGIRKLILDLARLYPKYNIIIRPHPVENTLFWDNISKKAPNIKVNSNYEVVPWILEAQLVIQNDCTTGVEAKISGVPVVNFVDKSSSRSKFKLFSMIMTEIDDAQDIRLNYRKSRSEIKIGNNTNIIANYIDNVGTKDLAAEKIVIHILSQLEKQNKQKYDFLDFFGTFFRRVKTMRFPKYRSNKFSGINKKDFTKKVRMIEKSINSTEPVVIRKISNDLFLIRGKKLHFDKS